MKDAYEELKALAGAAAIMQDDQTILAALAIAEGRMQSAALVYIMLFLSLGLLVRTSGQMLN
ncbi:MAG: hypothetical protein OK454_05825, partial [Thaumarchaeota archaeon]|nr:hypothetical protein [Nitrososphaerota archaeon]